VSINDVISHVFRRLGCRSHRLLSVGIDFVHEAITAHIHINTLSGIDHKVRISVRFLNDRAAVELVDMNKLRSDRCGEHKVVPGYIRGSAKNQARKRTAHITAKQFTICGETAGRNHYTVLSKIVRLVKISLGSDTDYAACVVR